MDIQQLRMILKVSESRNLTEAAESIFLAQSSLTYQINQVERELGFRIFDRDRYGTRLTSEGRDFCASIQEILLVYDHAIERGKRTASEQPSSTVHMGIPRFADRGLRDMLYIWKKVHPEISLEPLVCNDITAPELLDKNEIDIYFSSDAVFDQVSSDDKKYVELFKSTEVCLMSINHKLAENDSVSFSDLRGSVVLIVPQGKVSYVADHERKYIAENEPEIEVRDLDDIEQALIFTGTIDAVCIYDDEALEEMPRGVVGIPLEWDEKCSVGVMYLERNEPRLQEVLSYFKNDYVHGGKAHLTAWRPWA